MQWRKLARSKITSGRSRTRNMLCCGRRKENGREVPDITASPGRAPPVPATRPRDPPPMVIQGDFRKVSGISTEIFRQIEQVENDHDATTAAALEAVERRGEMIVRILDPRHMGRTANESAKRFLTLQDAKHTVQFVEIVKRPGQTLGLYIREGNGIDRNDGVFISRIALESAVYNSGCLKVGDEILAVNLVDVTRMSLDDVVIIMSIPRRLVLATRQRKGSKGGVGSPSLQPRSEHKPPPVVVIKRELRDDENDEVDDGSHPSNRDSIRQRHTGDGREMSESRSRLGLGLTGFDSRHTTPQDDRNGLVDLYYNSRPPDSSSSSWGYQPPPPVITEQPKSSIQHFQPYERQYPKTLESLAEKVHPFYTGPVLPSNGRRMSAGAQPLSGRITPSRDGGASHYYVQHGATGSRRLMPRSGSDQHLPRVEYSDYTSITQAGRHSLLRSSLKSGSTLSRYNQRYGQTDAQLVSQSKYGTSAAATGAGQYTGATGTLTRRNRPSLDYSSDTEATCGPRSSSYYYYNRSQSSVPHSTIPTLARTSTLTSSDITTKFNSLPRDTRGATRLQMKRFGDRTGVSTLLQDDSDGALSAPEMPSIRRDRGRFPSSPSVFTSDEYRAWLSRTPSTSAIYEQIRASRDVLNQQRAARFTFSAENIHDALKQTESYYGAYGARQPVTSTLDRHFSSRSQQPSIPSRSLSSQHITSSTSALGSSRSPSMRRMRNLLELEQSRLGTTSGLPSPGPVPTPSTTLPRSHTRQIDINPAEFLKYKLEKPVGSSPSTTGLSGLTGSTAGSLTSTSGFGSSAGVSGMLWVHLLAGRGLRAPSGSSAATTPVTPSGGAPSSISGSTGLRDLYCVLECDRVHKARTVVRTGDLVFDWDESFELDLVNNKELDLLIYSWDPQYRHKLCYKGSVHLESLLKNSPIHQLALKIEPRGTLYLRLRHTDSIQLYRRRGLPSLTLSRTSNPPLFGADLETVVTREAKTGGVPGGVATSLAMTNTLQVPIIIKRCVEEIERRGLDIIGLYRLCGSATKKRILREAFERNSRSVDLTPDNVPDINVITGVLKDYLRELPEPLFTKCLYQMMVDALGVCLPDDPEGNAKLMFSILDCLPRVNRVTLIFLMDHLAMVVSNSDRNKMSAQNLAIALAPPLMLHSATDASGTAPLALPSIDLDYNQPINVLKYLLQIWPAPKTTQSGRRARPVGPRGDTRSVLQAGPQAPAVAALRGPHQPSAVQSPVAPRSAPSGMRVQSQAPVQSLQTPGQSSVNKGAYRPLSPRVGPISQPVAPKSRQVIVSSPGSPSSSSDSQSGSDTIKHNIPSRVNSPNPRQSPSLQSLSRASPNVGRNSPSLGRASPNLGRASPSNNHLGRNSPNIVGRSSSPAMQASNAGLAVTMNGPSTLSALQTTISNINTTANNIFMSTNYQAQPPNLKFVSTNPFLTGAYLTDTYDTSPYNTAQSIPTSKYNTIGSKNDIQKYGSYDYSVETSKYSTLGPKITQYMSQADTQMQYTYSTPPTLTSSHNIYTSGGGNNGKYNTIGSQFKYDIQSEDGTKYGNKMKQTFDHQQISTSQANNQGGGGTNSGLLGVEDTPTPTSSIETEDSNTREVGEKDVEGDAEQSD